MRPCMAHRNTPKVAMRPRTLLRSASLGSPAAIASPQRRRRSTWDRTDGEVAGRRWSVRRRAGLGGGGDSGGGARLGGGGDGCLGAEHTAFSSVGKAGSRRWGQRRRLLPWLASSRSCLSVGAPVRYIASCRKDEHPQSIHFLAEVWNTAGKVGSSGARRSEFKTWVTCNGRDLYGRHRGSPN